MKLSASFPLRPCRLAAPGLVAALTLSLASCGAPEAPAPDGDAPAPDADTAAPAADDAEVVAGVWQPDVNDHLPWRFLPAELDHIARGRFWERGWDQGNRHGTNPITAISAYHDALEALGVRLLVVPVPPKAAVLPDQLPDDVDQPQPVDEFYDLLRANGVEVVDLLPGLQVERIDSPMQIYCRTDTHWSPSTGAIAARTVAALIAEEPWVAGLADGERFVAQPEAVLAFHGDLLEDGEKVPDMLERLPIQQITDRDQTDEPVAHDPASPVLVIGDSHAMVFSTGSDMHAAGAGFVDHLQAALGFPVDVSANRGSGIDAARGSVARRSVQEPDMWEGKKVVVWLFTGREFTQGRWAEIPPLVEQP